MSNVFNVSFRDFSEPSKRTVVSSANCDKVYTVSAILIPFISLFDLNRRERISAQSKKIYGDKGSPCL